MFTSTINPLLLQLGPFEIRWYGVCMALAFLTGYLLLRKLAKEKGINEQLIENLLLWLIPGILIGARIVEILIYEPHFYFADPIRMLEIWKGGIASHGGIAGALVVIYFFAKKHKLRFYQITDLIAIPFTIGATFVRIGNFTNGELVGRITQVPWAVKFPAAEGFRHPSQLYEAASHLLLAGILWNFRKLKEGMLTWITIGGYSILRFGIEFFKEFQLYWGLTIGQWLSLLGIIISGIFLWKINADKSHPNKLSGRS